MRRQHLREYIDLVKIAINMEVAFDICFPSFRSAIREFELKKDRICKVYVRNFLCFQTV